MKNLSKNEYKLYESLSKLTQEDLMEVLESFLVENYSHDRVIETPDYLYAIGNVPVMLVAHMDTVHTSAPDEIFYDRAKNVIWSPQGIGADDRAGVYTICKLILEGHRPSVLFTTDEEIGGLGADIASIQIVDPEVNFVIQLDRRGEKDSVYYDCDNPDFEKYINKFGFETEIGSFSDISRLCPEWKVAGVNLSIGYEDEHTKYERLYVSHMLETKRKVAEILLSVKEEDKFEYIESRTSMNSYFSRISNYRKDVGYSTNPISLSGTVAGTADTGSLKKEICYNCFNDFSPEMIIDTGASGRFCGDCYAALFTTCHTCHNSFKDATKTHLQCYTCRRNPIEEKEF